MALRIEEILEEWKPRTTQKQRVTGTRVHRQLVEEEYQVGITTVREYLLEKKRKSMEVYIPLVYRPGDCAQVDFFEVTVEEDGVKRKAWKFLMRLMYSGRDFVWLYDRCDQLSFLDAHVQAFAFFGFVPQRIIYDNLTAAGKKRVGLMVYLTDRFLALSSHYLFEPCFARPGEGHDKGGVESRGKGIRLQHLTPIPRGKTLQEIAQKVLDEVDGFCSRRVNREGRTVAERFAEERLHLLPLPDQPFEARLVVLSSANKQALVRVEGADYSVPSHWARLKVTAHVGVNDIQISCLGEQITVPKVREKQRKVQYKHYLTELARKPQALRFRGSSRAFGRAGRALQTVVGTFKRYTRRTGCCLLPGCWPRFWELSTINGQQAVAEALHKALDEGRVDLLALRSNSEHFHLPDVRVEVPKSLEKYKVESAKAADYDVLLGGRS